MAGMQARTRVRLEYASCKNGIEMVFRSSNDELFNWIERIYKDTGLTPVKEKSDREGMIRTIILDILDRSFGWAKDI